ncbi:MULTISPECIES: hypothetical protein [unclassified Rhizobium]|uniref:hypothetical protein n=1 Tax=unclassified Rhizobium TaxID=2613769 RepID=UPI0007141A18|nr:MULTISPECIES: hypothetical protein [unclassified Rhizobium]KQS83826.1 hypothetical protein ASG50_10905 [Rhizobium sp. Leaf386]KQT04963.1 hypothetical protein ASG42_22590 [Rhizobium sp. Leaf391]KQU08766.1 hypothetical protein ASG68_21550 [Rhizobium sp. Leaf453]
MLPITGYALLGMAIVFGLFVPPSAFYFFLAPSLAAARKKAFSQDDPEGRLLDEAVYGYMISRLGRLHIRLLLIMCLIFTISGVINIIVIAFAANS